MAVTKKIEKVAKKTADVVKRPEPVKRAQGAMAQGTGPSNGQPGEPTLEDLKNKLILKRNRPAKDEESEPIPLPVSAGPVDKIVDMVFNPSQEKMLEFTVLDRNQARLIPQLGIIDGVWEYTIEVAFFRYSSELYKSSFKKERPSQENLMKRFIFLTAQCQKSLQGQNLKSAIDLALADVETRGQEGDELLGDRHGFEE